MEPITQGIQELLNSVVLFIPRLIASLVVLGLSLLIATLISRWVNHAMQRRKADTEITILVTNLTRYGIITLGVILALQQVNFDVTAFLTGLGILGFTIGFAIQDVSKNFIAGMLLLLQQPFEIGEVIEVGDFTGTVEKVDLRATELRALDGKTVLIPNADVFTSPIINYGRNPRRRLELTVGVAYDSDLDLVSRTALEAIHTVEGLIEDPAPEVVFSKFGGSSIDFTLYYWVDTAKTGLFRAQDSGVRVIKSAFKQAQIEIPYPIVQLLQ